MATMSAGRVSRDHGRSSFNAGPIPVSATNDPVQLRQIAFVGKR